MAARTEPDLDRPLVLQTMAMTKEAYELWVHEPCYGRVGRLFASDWMERLTVTPWQAIPLLWLPIAAALMAGFLATSPSAAVVSVTAAVSLLLWSLTEYTLHRAVFHVDGQLLNGLPDHPWARGAHFLMHGCHHKCPDDGGRLVMAPVLGFALTGVVYCVCRAMLYSALPADHFNFAIGCGILGYVVYDLTHYWMHHGPSSWMSRLHAKHHSLPSKAAAGFGISFLAIAWDRVMATAIDRTTTRREAAPSGRGRRAAAQPAGLKAAGPAGS